MSVAAATIRRYGRVILFFSLVVGALCGASRAAAQVEAHVEARPERHFGFGLIVGHPTGLSLKGFLTPSTAIDGAIGFGNSFRYIHLHADYLWHFDVQRWDATTLKLYLGVGPELAFQSHPAPPRGPSRTDFFLGARAPFGFSLMFGAPFEVFAELVAGVWFAEEQLVHVDAALGGRFWF
jgi:hypothetical protein